MVNLKLKLPDGFLEEEVRDGYLVSKKMKEVWAVELDLLAEFDRVCRENDIDYFVCEGTLLGAIRHKGFIPWDDDIDVMVTRENYKKLCKIATKNFKEPYFFQTEVTDPGSVRGHAQLRNSQTTGILTSELGRKYKFNQGIFLDIFPYDNLPDNEKECKRFIKKMVMLKKILSFYTSITSRYSEQKTLKGRVKKLLHIIVNPLFKENFIEKKLYEYLEHEADKYNKNKTERFSYITFFPNSKRYFRKVYFKECQYVAFEMLMVPVPKEYEKILCERYGEWKKFERGTSGHGGILFDTEKSYIEYI